MRTGFVFFLSSNLVLLLLYYSFVYVFNYTANIQHNLQIFVQICNLLSTICTKLSTIREMNKGYVRVNDKLAETVGFLMSKGVTTVEIVRKLELEHATFYNILRSANTQKRLQTQNEIIRLFVDYLPDGAPQTVRENFLTAATPTVHENTSAAYNEKYLALLEKDRARLEKENERLEKENKQLMEQIMENMRAFREQMVEKV